MEEFKLGIAPIGWSNDDMPELGGNISFEQCIDDMATAGFTGTEIGNKFPKEPRMLKDKLAKKGLQVVNAWFSTFILSKIMSENINDLRKLCQKLSILGATKVGVSEQTGSVQGQNVSVFNARKILTSEDFERLFNGLEDLGKMTKEEFNIDLVYHHHMGTVIQTAKETEILMNNTNEFVGLLLDVGHFAYAGEDYLGIIDNYHERIKHVHLKDIRKSVVQKVKDENLSFLEGVKLGTFTVPGDGDIDFVPVIEALRKYGYNGWLLVEAEQDPDIANPLDYAKKAMTYLKEILK